MNYINSDDNKTFKGICKLKSRKYRYLNREYLIEGIRFVKEALDSDCNVKYLILDESKKDLLFQKFDFENCRANVIVLHKALFSRVKQTESSQGIIASIEMSKPNFNFDFSNGIYFLIDKIQDPGNLGTIVRTAVAVGALGVIIMRGTVDLYNDKVLRATMGSIFKTNIYFMDEYSFLDKFVDNGFRIFLADSNSKNIYYNENLSNKIILTVGNEGNGISSDMKKFVHKDICIPMCNNFESLNVAQALSIIAFEHLRQVNS